jgi:8-oxo-dGTP diphosphatase
MPNTEPDIPVISSVHVAVGVVVNRDREVLVARRHDNQHQGGLWEFPGGKVMPGEEVREALARELAEEVNIEVRESSPFLKIHHDYGDKKVLLDVWYVSMFAGQATGCEGQPVKWITVDEFDYRDFPEANSEIINQVRILLGSQSQNH